MVIVCPNTCTPATQSTTAVHEKKAGTSTRQASACTVAIGTA